jgi:hypothetical protein
MHRNSLNRRMLARGESDAGREIGRARTRVRRASPARRANALHTAVEARESRAIGRANARSARVRARIGAFAVRTDCARMQGRAQPIAGVHHGRNPET